MSDLTTSRINSHASLVNPVHPNFLKICVILLFSYNSAFCQQTYREDSLKTELTNASSDDARIRIYHELADGAYQNSGIEYSKEALLLAKKSKDSKLIMKSLIHLGSLYSKTSNYNEALKKLDESVKVGVRGNHSGLLADAYLELGIILLRQQKLDSSRIILNKALALVQDKEKEDNKGFVFNVLGNVAKEENNFTEASEYYIQATVIFEKYKNDEGLTQSLANIGNIQYLLGNYDKALTYGLQCLAIAKKINKETSIGYANRLLGRIYRKQKRFDEALKNYGVASDVYRKLGEKRELGETYTNIGNIYFELEKFNRALEYYFDALRIKRSIPDSTGMAYDLTAAAVAFYHIKKPEMAILYIDSGMFFAKKKRIAALVMDGYQNKSDIYNELKQYQLAHENYVHYIALKDSLDILRNKKAADELEAKYQNEKKESEIKTLHAENQIKSLQLEQQRTQRIYLIGISLLSVLLITVLYNRYRIKQRSAEKLRQLDIDKSRFFANISHEFRTPLTLILSPLQRALAQPNTPLSSVDIQMMYRNSTRLHMLINQLLDLSRIESGKMTLQLQETDVRSVVMTLCSAFQSQAEQRSIEYKVNIQDNIGNCFVDRDKIEKIIYNLISNAFKFTSDGGRIVVDVHSEHDVTFKVCDNGIGIPTEHLPFIFDRFYQVDDSATRSGEGTGIGLALAKELAEVHRGTLHVSSRQGAGSEFVLTIPGEATMYRKEDFLQSSEEQRNIKLPHFEKSDLPEPVVTEEENELPLILIAEDNSDMRLFIRETLQTNYRIEEAEDGIKAWEKTLESVPDLVITDVMMPRMDGTAFCDKLKGTSITSHIPVVMLTAKAGLQSKLDGLQRGADDYLVKPFDVQELKVRVLNLIKQRKKLRELYRSEITLQPKDVVVSSADAEFIRKVSSILEEQFSDASFGVEEFNKAIGFSRMQLHRKLKALTDQSTGEFIRNFRLGKAKKLLVINGAQVSQVAYDCGFNNVSHFSKSFKEHTGMTPSDFMEKEGETAIPLPAERPR